MAYADVYTDGKSEIFASKWRGATKPGKWYVQMNVINQSGGDMWFYVMFDAVIDDFGNLVKVAS